MTDASRGGVVGAVESGGISDPGVARFEAELRSWGLTELDVWFGGIALRNTTTQQYELAVGQFLILAAGVEPPDLPAGTFVDDQALHVVGVSGRVPLASQPELFRDLASHRLPDFATQLFGRPIGLPWSAPLVTAATPGPIWQFQTNHPHHHDGSRRIFSQRPMQIGIGKLFGDTCADIARRALISSSWPQDGLKEFSKTLGTWMPVEHNGSMPTLELVAELPFWLDSFEYQKAHSAYVASVRAAAGLPLDSAKLSTLTPLRGSHPSSRFERVQSHKGVDHLELRIPAKHLKDNVNSVLVFQGQLISERMAGGKPEPFSLQFVQSETEVWETELSRSFRVDPSKLSRALKRYLPAAVFPSVRIRIRDAIELQESRAFYSLLATGSIVEALLRVRLRRYGRRKIAGALAHVGKSMPGKPVHRLMLNDLVEIATVMTLVDGLGARAYHQLRDARNSIHLDLSSKRVARFSPADAQAAILAMIELAKKLTGVADFSPPSA
jgi:hypothetical protein